MLLLSISYTGKGYKELRKWWHTRTFGVDAALIQRKQPEVMMQKLEDVRKTIDSVRWNTDFTELQLRSFLHHHCLALLFNEDHVADVLQAVAEAIGLSMACKGLRKSILFAPPELFGRSPASIIQRMLYFRNKYKSNERTSRGYDEYGSFTKVYESGLRHKAEVDSCGPKCVQACCSFV